MTPKIRSAVVSTALMAGLIIGAMAVGTTIAAPVITAFSSTVTSGTATNKDNDQDLMYLMTQGGTVTFQVTATGAEAYEWRVNKSVQAGATGNSLNWTVPNEKGIWEIHLKVTGGGAEAHQEWVLSTLSNSEAPDIFDYFTDRKCTGRTDTDPWNRALPEWTGNLPDLSGFCVKTDPHVQMTTPSTITEGTWKFRYRFKYPSSAGQGGNTHVGFYPIYKRDRVTYCWNKVWDAHHHCVIETWVHGQRAQFSMEYDGCSVYEDGKWHQIILIRKGNYFYAFKEMKHESLSNSVVMFEFRAYDPVDEISDIFVYMRNYGSDNSVPFSHFGT